MEFFLLVKKSFKNKAEIHKHCIQFDSSYEHISFDNWELYFGGKNLIDSKQFVESAGHILLINGTLVYRNLGVQQSIDKIFEEFKANSLNQENWFGNYCVIHAANNEFRLTIDPFGIQNLYSNDNFEFYTNSFLLSALLLGHNNLRLNSLALAENLLTGSLIGPDTIFEKIIRYEPHMDWNNDNVCVNAAEAVQYSNPLPKTQDEAINEQIEFLRDTFDSLKKFANETGIDSGITSGLDSRLLLAFIKRHWDNYQLHTHYRSYESNEVNIASLIASSANSTLKIEEVVPPELKSEDNLRSTLRDAFRFTDGFVRMHGFWYEDYNTSLHRTSVLGKMKTGISGIGGEQYRNMELEIRGKINLKSFVRYQWINSIARGSILSKNFEEDLVNRISDKISAKLHLQKRKSITFSEVKRIWNEIFIPARLGGRNNAENKLTYFISPFALSQVSVFAYRAIPFLGHAYKFQIDLLKKVSPKFAEIQSDYGFDFYKKQPKSLFFKALYKSFIPFWFQEKIKQRKVKKKGNYTFNKILSSKPFLNEYVTKVELLDMPIDWNTLKLQADLAPLLINVGYWLKELEGKGNNDR